MFYRTLYNHSACAATLCILISDSTGGSNMQMILKLQTVFFEHVHYEDCKCSATII